MDAPFPDVDPAEAALGQLAGLDLTLARHVHACAMATEDPTEVANLVHAYQRVSRCARQNLALQARMRRERERDSRENPPPPKPPPPTPARDAERIAERQDAVRTAAQRVVWAEHEPADWNTEDEEADYLFSLLEERLQLGARDNTFGLTVENDAWAVQPLDEHIVQVCESLGLPEVAARAWRELPDPPPEALDPPDDDEHESSG